MKIATIALAIVVGGLSATMVVIYLGIIIFTKTTSCYNPHDILGTPWVNCFYATEISLLGAGALFCLGMCGTLLLKQRL